MTEILTIRSGIQYVQSVLQQITVLLRTADPILDEHGFGALGNVCFDDTSTHLLVPKKWLPHVAFRFYSSEESPRVLLFVSVLLDDRGNEYEPMEECLLTAGAIIHKGEEWTKSWCYWWARWHGFHRPRHDDGRIVCVETKDWAEQTHERKVIERIFTKGVPLPSVQNAAELKSFLEPLLLAVAPYRQGDAATAAPDFGIASTASAST